MKRSSLAILAGALFVGIAILDWVTKVVSEAYLVHGPITLIDGFAWFRLAYNRGVAFSALEGVPHWVLGIGAIVLLAFVLWGLRAVAARPVGAISLAMVAAGGLCNAIDRLHDGKVTDMISVWKWPVFNVADIAITVGVALLFIATRKEKAAASAASAQPAGDPPAA